MCLRTRIIRSTLPSRCHPVTLATGPMSQSWRSLRTAAPLGRVLPFPVRSDPTGQIELFPEPDPPDPHSSTKLIVEFTLLQIRVTRIAPDLSPSERLWMFGAYHVLLPTVEQLEEAVAVRRMREAARQISLIA